MPVKGSVKRVSKGRKGRGNGRKREKPSTEDEIMQIEM
jgi:hypothetical protein